VIRAFWFVTTRSFMNRMLSRLRKLRSVRYAISMAAGLAYLWFVAFRRMAVSSHSNAAFPASGLGVDILSTIALIAMLFVWALPDSGGGLTFSAAEIQFLFPAPLRRRDLLLYKLFRQQPSLLISAAMTSWFAFRHAKFVGLWAAFIVMSIYFTMVSLARARLKRMHVGFLARLAVTLAAAAGILALIFFDIRDSVARPGFDLGTALRSSTSVFQTPWVKAIMFLPRLFAGAAGPAGSEQLIASCAGLALLGFALFQIAARLDVSFEDASLEASQRRAEATASAGNRRFGRRVMFRRIPPPFRLTGSGGPELAIIWKNLTACLRISIAWIVLIVAIFLAFVGEAAITRSAGMQMGAAAMGLMLCAFFPFIGSQALRQDLRLDLPRIELLKSFPVRGDRLVAAEIAAPTIVVSIVELFLLIATAILTRYAGAHGQLAIAGTPEFIVLAMLFAIPICAAQLLIQNAVVILLPGWAIQSGEESRGFAVLGQRLVILGGSLVVLLAGLVPAAIVFAPLFYLARRFGSNPFVLAISTAPAIAVLVVEIWVSIRFLGNQFDQIDITNEIDAAM
jgi:ABC-2 type transport system permease protein